MAFRLWLRLSKVFVALSSASERISTVVKEHRAPSKTAPPRP
jgi:hypothetical protein